MQPTPELRKSQVLIMATAAGIFAANLYYNQPILAQMAATFGATESAVGKVPALTQAGYGAGLFFLTPLGDMIERKRLIAMLGALSHAGARRHDAGSEFGGAARRQFPRRRVFCRGSG